MDISLWPQPESVFSCQFSVLSESSESLLGFSSPSPFDGWLLWIGAKDVETAWVVPDESHHDDDKPADGHNSEPHIGGRLDSTALLWNTLRLLLACSTFQTFVRPTRGEEFPMGHTHAAESYRYRGSLRYYNADDLEPSYVRPRCYAPTLGRFMPRDPR